MVPQNSRLLDIVEEEGEQAQLEKEQETGWSPLLFDMDLSEEESMHGSTILTPVPAAQPAAQGERTPQRESVLVHREDEFSSGSFRLADSLPPTPSPQRFRVTRHTNTERKMIDWNLIVKKKWLIVGDSNLSRIPGHQIPDLQVESFPGANFRHAEALMAKSTSEVVAEKVVLAFGINSRGQKARETAVKQLQGAVRAAKRKFRHAQIWVPQINFSSSLPTEEKNTLSLLNSHITRNMPYIPALKATEFITGTDNVHWTRETAVHMFDHWVACLNLSVQ